MAKPLLILESPNKAKTVQKFMGDGFTTIATGGHIKDLPKKVFAVDIEHDFAAKYVIIDKAQKAVDTIRKEAAVASVVYVATDPDREGEAIAKDVVDVIKDVNPALTVYRIRAKEINAHTFQDQIAHPGQLDVNMYSSQHARRTLDRIVGFQMSPLLWKKVKSDLSAGRVQSIAVKIIVDRENEIRKHVAIEYWEIASQLKTPHGNKVTAELSADGDQTIYSDPASVEKYHPKGVIANETQASEIVARSKAAPFIVREIKRVSKAVKPDAPFSTSDLQAKAASVYRFSAKKTMDIAQQLFAGLDRGPDGSDGIISYHRTDSVRVSEEAIADCRQYIEKTFGKAYLPDEPVHYEAGGKKSKKAAAPIQDAHEAIRPLSVARTPDSIKQYLTPDQYKIYSLIWKRFVASQMKPAVNDTTTIYIQNGDLTYRLSGSIPKFDGFRRVTGAASDAAVELPELKKGEVLDCLDVTSKQKMTPPPRRYTESEFIQYLKETGIGRPSTYATMLEVIQTKRYVKVEKGVLVPTELGEIVTEKLVRFFEKDVMNIKFTAELEKSLDAIAEGRKRYVDVLREFYASFCEELKDAEKNMASLKGDIQETDLVCDKCGSKMVIKWGKNGYFLACSEYPKCKNTGEFEKTEDGKVVMIKKEVEKCGVCPDCGHDLIYKSGKHGRFIACSNYPDCKHTESIRLNVSCPNEGCPGRVIVKRGKRGNTFYGCDQYPNCNYVSWNEPTEIECPECQKNGIHARMEIVRRKDKAALVCSKCKYSRPYGEDESDI